MKLTDDPCENTKIFLKKIVKNFEIIHSSQFIGEDIFYVKFIHNNILYEFIKSINVGNNKYYNFIEHTTKLTRTNHKDGKNIFSNDDIENFFAEKTIKFFKKWINHSLIN
jgi:6-phosphogluconate dehydrogenase